MKFTVVWLPSARARLANLWINAADRQAITDAANRIDRTLARDAHLKGREFNGRRLLVDRPLAITFDVSVDDRLVTVTQVDRI